MTAGKFLALGRAASAGADDAILRATTGIAAILVLPTLAEGSSPTVVGALHCRASDASVFCAGAGVAPIARIPTVPGGVITAVITGTMDERAHDAVFGATAGIAAIFMGPSFPQCAPFTVWTCIGLSPCILDAVAHVGGAAVDQDIRIDWWQVTARIWLLWGLASAACDNEERSGEKNCSVDHL